MIESFRDKALREFFATGASAKITATLQKRIRIRLDAMDAATKLTDLEKPGFNFHPLNGKPQRYSIHVNGPWCLTFEWNNSTIYRVDLEQYH